MALRSERKKRIDVLLVERGLVSSRERAQRLILAGQVLVNDEPVTHAGKNVLIAADIRIRGEDSPFVSRAALKLKHALEHFRLKPHGIALDVGASTGGFTQVLLEAGVVQVFAVDVGHNQLHWRLRSDARVRVIEKLNARTMNFEDIGQRVDWIVADVSFISLTLIFPRLVQFCKPATELVTLIKPQFEVGREFVGKGGIVNDAAATEDAIARVIKSAQHVGFVHKGLIESPIRGSDGNAEYLSYFSMG